MEQAKALNPASSSTGWPGAHRAGSAHLLVHGHDQLPGQLAGCAASHGLTINYLGGWNERGYNISWYEQLRSTLNADGYSGVQIVGADSDWSIATDIADNSAFATRSDHRRALPSRAATAAAPTLPGHSTAEGTGKPLWASENGSQDLNSGAPGADPLDHPRLHRRRPDRLHQLAADRRDLPQPALQHRRADPGQPALVRRVQRGREPVGHRTGHPVHRAGLAVPQLRLRLPGRSESNGSYVSLKSTDGTDYSTIIETTTATAAQTVTVPCPAACPPAPCTCGPPTSTPPARDPSCPAGEHHPGRRRLLAHRPARLHLHADHHQRPGQGHRGQPRPGHPPLPYSDNFDSDTAGQQPLPLPAAGRVRGRALHRRPLRPVRPAAGRGPAGRVG